MYRREKGNPSGEEVDDEVDGWDRRVEVHFSFLGVEECGCAAWCVREAV